MIEKVNMNNFDAVLPLIAEYQRFYGIKHIDLNKNKTYFSQFVSNNKNGGLYMLVLDNKAIGFATIYKGFSSTRAEEVAILNDLYVQPNHRGLGFGEALVQYARKEAKAMGYQRLQWLTAQDNKAAQQLYNKLGAQQSSWFFYAKEI